MSFSPLWYPKHLCLYFCFANKFTCILFLESTYKQHYSVFVFLWLPSLWMTVSRSSHISAKGTSSFLFMAEEYSTVYMYHFLFIHYAVHGHLGCLHVLVTVNSAAMNLRVHVSFWIMVFSRYMPKGQVIWSFFVELFKESPYGFL